MFSDPSIVSTGDFCDDPLVFETPGGTMLYMPLQNFHDIVHEHASKLLRLRTKTPEAQPVPKPEKPNFTPIILPYNRYFSFTGPLVTMPLAHYLEQMGKQPPQFIVVEPKTEERSTMTTSNWSDGIHEATIHHPASTSIDATFTPSDQLVRQVESDFKYMQDMLKSKSKEVRFDLPNADRGDEQLDGPATHADLMAADAANAPYRSRDELEWRLENFLHHGAYHSRYPLETNGEWTEEDESL